MKLCFALALMAASRVAFADPRDPAALFREGQAAYDQQHYDDALAAWEQSYALSHLPALLYNIAQAYRLRGKPGDCVTARTDYQRFIDGTPPSPERELATRYIAELARCVNPPVEPAPATASSAPPVTSSTPDLPISSAPPPRSPLPRHSHGVAIGGVALGIAGVGLLATGIAIGHHASTLGDDVTQACSISCDWTAEKSRDSAGRRDAALGWAFDGIGAAALVGSVVLLYFGVREHGVTVLPAGTSPGAALVWRHTW